MDYQVCLSRAEMTVLVGLVRRARVNAQRRYERRHLGESDPCFRKSRYLRDLQRRLLEVMH
jgi:hypothetical protein